MFNIVNLQTDISMTVSHNGNTITFEIFNLINTRLKNELIPARLFQVLNSYLDYKGDEFKNTLYDTIKESYNLVLISAMNNDIYPLPTHIVHDVLNLFDLNDMVQYIKKSGIKSPSVLGDTYDGVREQNDQGSREQTYLKEDYYELLALINIMKVTLPIMGMYVTLKKNVIIPTLKEYVIYNFYVGNDLYETSPFQKLYDYIHKLVDIASQKEDFSKRIIEKNIPKDDMTDYVLASALFQRLVYINELDGIEDKNVITKLYSYVVNSIKLKATENSSKIRIKNPVGENASNDSESESEMETNRTPADITFGHIEEFKYALSKVSTMASLMGLSKHQKEINSSVTLFKNIPIGDIPDMNVEIAFYIISSLVDIRSIDYVNIENVVNSLAVAYAWCLVNDFKTIAYILASNTVNYELEVFKYNTGHKTKISKELKDELNRVYPYRNVVVIKDETTYVNRTEVMINKLSARMSKSVLVSILDQETLKATFGTNDKVIKIPQDIRNDLATLFIHLAK